MKNLSKIHWGAIGFSAALVGGSFMLASLNAAAQPGERGPRPGPREFIERADANGDGSVSFEEIQAIHPDADKAHFDRMDTNGDGVLNEGDRPERPHRGDGPGLPGPAPEGMPAPPHVAMMTLMEKVDADKDGNVTLEEFKAIPLEVLTEFFKVHDINGDGVLNEADRPEGPWGGHGPGMPGRGPEGMRGHGDRPFPGGEGGPEGKRGHGDRPFPGGEGGPEGKRDHGDHPGPQGMRGDHPRDGHAFLEKADTNQNGGVSLEELRKIRPDVTEEYFGKRDVNGDGVLNEVDHPVGPQARRDRPADGLPHGDRIARGPHDARGWGGGSAWYGDDLKESQDVAPDGSVTDGNATE